MDENRVKIHLRAIFRKTGARNRTEAALRAPFAATALAPTLGALPAPPAEALVPAVATRLPADEIRAIA
jgi:hypothetical protein